MIVKTITRKLGTLEQPVVTLYQLGVLFFREYIKSENKTPDLEEFDSVLQGLFDVGVLTIHKNFKPKHVFNIIGKNDPSVDEISCSVDTFAFISHLSAMEYHGLTDRLPKTLFISTPPLKDWQTFASQKMKRDCGDFRELYNQTGFPQMTWILFSAINKTPVRRYSSIHLGAYKAIKGKALKVSTLGRTFLDMVREPDLCGGINHVIDVYKEFAEKYEKLIVNEVDRHGNLIEKTRAGYLLDEACGIKSKIIDGWAKRAQRGGSRKLDPKGEYSSNYSERWSLSLNNE